MKQKIKMAILWIFNREKYRIIKRIEKLEQEVAIAMKNHKRYACRKMELEDLKLYLENL